jgi:hypothetical protein
MDAIPNVTNSNSDALSLADLPHLAVTVPCVTLFYAADGVVVQYVIRIAAGRQHWHVGRRFRDLLAFEKAVTGIVSKDVASTWRGFFGQGRRQLPKLERSSVGTTNKSARLIGRRRELLDRFFVEFTDIAKSRGSSGQHDAARALLRHLCQLCPSNLGAPASLIPPDYRATFGDDRLVSAFFAVPADVARPASCDGQVSRLTVCWPRAAMYLDGRDVMVASLSCERAEQRAKTMFRYAQLLRFYQFVRDGGDKLPTPDEAVAFCADDAKTHSVTANGEETSARRLRIQSEYERQPAAGAGDLASVSSPRNPSRVFESSRLSMTSSTSAGHYVRCTRSVPSDDDASNFGPDHDDDGVAYTPIECGCTELSFCGAPGRYTTKNMGTIEVHEAMEDPLGTSSSGESDDDA